MHKCMYDGKILHIYETLPIALFNWKPVRNSDYAKAFLNGFLVTIVTDGY